MASYFLRLSGVNLIVMFGFHGSAGLSEFVCSQWERKGMDTDVYFYAI